MIPRRQCLDECGMVDIPYGGHFTWSNKKEGDERVFSKIDRVMANERWLDSYAKSSCPLSIKRTIWSLSSTH
ncbi:3-methyl-2-oxobutanoate hydroxymethyltransferase [Bienertia sinuspersici]